MKGHHGMKKSHEQHHHDHEGGAANHGHGTQHHPKAGEKAKSEHSRNTRVNKKAELSRNHGHDHAEQHGRPARMHGKKKNSLIHPHSDLQPA